MIDLTVITSTIPERSQLLNDLGQCIARQTVRPYGWDIATDWDRKGPAHVLNDLAANVETEWLFRCDDDDLYDDNHFETLAPHLDEGDIVYTWPRVDPPGWIGREELQVQFPLEWLERMNWIASAAAIRTDLWAHLGGLHDVHNEDHDFWKRAHRAGARFVCIPQVTWTYRLGDWPHLSDPNKDG